MSANGTTEPVWSVSAVNRAVKETLEGAFMPFWMGGEVGSLLIHRSGHAYFQMKDEKSQIKVCWFGGAQQCRTLGVENGSVVEVFGNLSVYDVRGEYQFSVKKLRLAGIGTLQQRFEELKRKLEAEGLFDPAKKKAIP
ncbi:MAG: exodeoxyribonuclease VII large subunit, partial [Lentisphaeria bacterium]|nr:exodeoxyribonuclease VII large subunit [Lentisphaeria bacterium]